MKENHHLLLRYYTEIDNIDDRHIQGKTNT